MHDGVKAMMGAEMAPGRALVKVGLTTAYFLVSDMVVFLGYFVELTSWLLAYGGSDASGMLTEQPRHALCIARHQVVFESLGAQQRRRVLAQCRDRRYDELCEDTSAQLGGCRAMKTVILIPWRSDNGGRRDQLWDFTRNWLLEHHPDYPLIAEDSGGGVFNRGRAINNAAAQEDWDVAIVHDADNIADPEQIREAVGRADQTGKVIFPHRAYMYLDEHSTSRLMSGEGLFLCPFARDDLPTLPWAHNSPYEHTLRHHHYSGVQVIPRQAWEQVGGFIEMDGWGAEDASMKVLFETFTAGVEWTQGTALHLWHQPAWLKADRRTRRMARTNTARLRRIQRRRGNQRSLRELMRRYGHIIPVNANSRSATSSLLDTAIERTP